MKNINDRILTIRKTESDFLKLCKIRNLMTHNDDHQIPIRERMRVKRESDRGTFTFVSKRSRIRTKKTKRRKIELKMLDRLHQQSKNDMFVLSLKDKTPIFRRRKKKKRTIERKPEEETVFDMLGSSDDSRNKKKKIKSRSLLSTHQQHHPVNGRVIMNGFLGSNNPKFREQSIAFQTCHEPLVFNSYSGSVLKDYSKFDESLIERIFPSYSSSFI